jgi:hypothetical protein
VKNFKKESITMEEQVTLFKGFRLINENNLKKINKKDN